MILLSLKLQPSSLANKFLFFMASRLFVGVAAFFVLFFVHIVYGALLLVLYVLLTVGYYFYLHRLALAVFLLAQRAVSAVDLCEQA